MQQSLQIIHTSTCIRKPHGTVIGTSRKRLTKTLKNETRKRKRVLNRSARLTNADLVEVQWHDAHGRLLPGPVGPGPWLVHATAADGRTARRLLR